MNKFGKTSESRLARVHPSLVRVAREVIQIQDCKVIYGARTQKEQINLVKQGLSRTFNSKHLINPSDGFSHAIDIAPYPIDWNDTKRFYYFAGMFLAKADSLHVGIRWGGNWDMDEDLNDQSFMDLVHFELRK